MLIILVGGTLEVSHKSWTYFQNRGYSIIQKYNYLPADSLTAHYNTFQSYDEATVDRCDFVYTIHNGKTGFYKDQILAAATGRDNALMTMSPDNLEFIHEIKDAYKEYVQLVYLYIDPSSLETMTRNYIHINSDIERRLQKGADIRRMYLENMLLFDKTVIYNEGSEFGYDALYAQFDRIITEADALQEILNNRRYVDLPYTGTQNYVFVSYSHRDDRVVLPHLSALRRDGYRIWYDKGIHKGANWQILLGERLKGCTNFLLFSSANAVKSPRVEDEVSGAKMCDHIHSITVRLDDAQFPFGYEMYLQKYQNIMAGERNVLDSIKEALAPSTKC